MRCECPCGCRAKRAKTGQIGFEDDALCAYCHQESRKAQVSLWDKLGLTESGEPKKGSRT